MLQWTQVGKYLFKCHTNFFSFFKLWKGKLTSVLSNVPQVALGWAWGPPPVWKEAVPGTASLPPPLIATRAIQRTAARSKVFMRTGRLVWSAGMGKRAQAPVHPVSSTPQTHPSHQGGKATCWAPLGCAWRCNGPAMGWLLPSSLSPLSASRVPHCCHGILGMDLPTQPCAVLVDALVCVSHVSQGSLCPRLQLTLGAQ